MDPNVEWDKIWNEVIDDCLKDNTEEEVIKLVREAEQQANNKPDSLLYVVRRVLGM
jgi:hypothetical protein